MFIGYNKINFMLRTFLLSFFLSGAVNFLQAQNNKLADAFIESLVKNKFEMLRNYLPSGDILRLAAPNEMGRKSAKQVDKAASEMHKQFETQWKTCRANALAKGMNLNALTISEAIVYNPFEKRDNKLKAMVIAYKYNDKVWDDITILVIEAARKIYISGIPNPTRAFSMNEENNGMELANARAYKQSDDPNTLKRLQLLSAQVMEYVRKGDGAALAPLLVYRGEEQAERRWKDSCNFANEADRAYTQSFIQSQAGLANTCKTMTFGKLKTERESEGVWFVLPVNCGADKKKIFAFLYIKGDFRLGDIDKEE
jgi:hypothetical protein